MRRFDAVVVGGGHNGLVAAAYLGRAGLRVAVVEARDRLGGPCGPYEFLPGRTLSFTNSPGSLNPAVVRELRLADHGLRFVRADPTVVHRFADRSFVGWRDQARVDRQLDALAAGESGRYRELIAGLDRLGAALGVSLDEPPPPLDELRGRLADPDDLKLFTAVFDGSLRGLLAERLHSEQVGGLLGMLALNAQLVPPSAPGTAIGLMMRPFARASAAGLRGPGDAERVALRGSTGLPVGSMSAIVDALEADCRAHGVEFHTGTPVSRILHDERGVRGVVTAAGEEFAAGRVVAAVNPVHLFRDLLDDGALGPDVRADVAGQRMRGSAFKLVLEVDSLPAYAGLPGDADPESARACQFRFGDSLGHIEESVTAALAGRTSERPLMWGLIPTLTSPGLTPGDTHLISVNAWHAPYAPEAGGWDGARTEAFGRRCVAVLEELMPGLGDRITGHRFLGPVEIERELGLVESNITHGDMLPAGLFGARPHPAVAGYRTPLRGFYLSGAGVWPGGYVTGTPGRNAARAVLSDLRAPAHDPAHDPTDDEQRRPA
ncbi:phytoene desaturase family protein [Streptomyces sp. CMB-StM0423]|uniref:phytoene desaturase family protein n=1 Tax=Streptomyces sp. CMB-StM0423 TaxID=2059884 RepID=UPI000C710B80|nr:NAD(P)/FAD-dependent oxidoreductase [Streptomyces sp. CMB-StM0423]AUH40847.1 NAD(P)/FAD-dependent oxidoreductase [Streptomyces sp. CMB-StM0423]